MINQIRRIDVKTLDSMMRTILQRENVQDSILGYVVNGLIQTSLRGVDSHGIRLFPHYIRALIAGRINGNPNIKFKKTSSTTGILDADHTFGHAAGMEAVKHVINMSKSSGSGHVAIKNSTHFGAAAYFALELAKNDIMGWSFTHADSLMLSHNGIRPYLGTNPYCFAAPCEGEEPFCLDMATTNISYNQVKGYQEDKKPIPEGFTADKYGEQTTNADDVSSLLPIGLYKGYGLSMMIEILCSQMTGMPYGRDIVPMFTSPIKEKRYLGHFISGLRIDCFQSTSSFKKNMKIMMDQIRSEPSKNPGNPVMVPNDPEKIEYSQRIKKGIPIKNVDWKAFSDLAKKYNINFKEKSIETI